MGRKSPVVDSGGKYTAVSVSNYHKTEGLILRACAQTTLIGYCRESPRNVLENVFRDYNVTSYNGYELFGSGDFKLTTPMVGLGIDSIEPPKVYGIKYDGKLNLLLKLDEVVKVKRDVPISVEDVDRIIAHLSDTPNNGGIDLRQVIDVIRKFR